MANLLKLLRSATTGNVPTTTDAAGYGQVAVNITDQKVFLRDSSGAAVAVADRIASYSASKKYAVGDFAVQTLTIYRCKTAIGTPEVFNAAKWDAMGSGIGLADAVILAPGAADRNVVTPTGDYPALKLLPSGGQSVALLDVNGTKHDARGLPVGRYGEVVFLVSQTSHGFTTVGQPVAYNHPNWVQAVANDSTKVVRAVVHEVLDTNNVLLQMGGRIASLNVGSFVGGSITAGSTYYLSTTAGKLTATAPTNAQPVLIALTSTTGVLLLANAAGVPIVSRSPTAGGQTVFEPLQVVNTAGTKGLLTTPASQTLSSIGGTPISLVFQESGELRLEGAIEITGVMELFADPKLRKSDPGLYFVDTSETDPVGRHRFQATTGGRLAFQKALTAELGSFGNIIDLDTGAGDVRIYTGLQVDGASSFVGVSAFTGDIAFSPTTDLLQANWGVTAAGVATFASTDVAGPETALAFVSDRGAGAGIMVSGNMAVSGGWALTNISLASLVPAGANQVRLGLPASGVFGVNAGAAVIGFAPTTTAIFASDALNLSPGLNLDGPFVSNSTGVFTSSLVLEGPTASNQVLHFRDSGSGITYAQVFTDSANNLIMRARNGAGATVASLVLQQDGILNQSVGLWNRVLLDDTVAPTVTNLNQHLRLHSAGYGINVQGAVMNLVVPASANVDVFKATTRVARFEDLDNTLPSDVSIVTRQKGDTRYRNADNLNAGTVPNARMPTDAAERNRILDLLSSMTIGVLGSTAMLRTTVNSGEFVKGATRAGSGLYYASASDANDATSPGGTWTCAGYIPPGAGSAGDRTTLWLRSL